MFPDPKIITKISMSVAIFGAVLGVQIGAFAQDFILWIVLMMGAGMVLGVALSYGFLPES